MVWIVYYYFETFHKKLNIVYKHQIYNDIIGKIKSHNNILHMLFNKSVINIV